MASQDQTATLDQLQQQVNLVLEQTGRVFAAVNVSPKQPPTAQLNKLKQLLPTANNRFHDALDQLETELQLAQLVMRRDLALLREKQGQQAPTTAPTQPVQETPSIETKDAAPPQEPPTVATEPESAKTDEGQDVAMEDLISEEKQAPAEEPAADVNMIEQPERTAPELPKEKSEEKPAEKPSSPTPPAPAPPGESQKQKEEGQTETITLQINVPPKDNNDKPTADEDPIPDTARDSNMGDLDSLFNDPTGDNNNDTSATDFNFDQDNSGDIDFGDFGTFTNDNNDNDNISSLLPGLEDYANTQTNNDSTELDLNTFFGTGDSNGGGGMDSQGNSNGEQRDTTFDDLMDLANFDGAGMSGNGDNPETLDFDSLFN